MQQQLDEQQRQARHKITRMLAKREHSQKEILQKLSLSGIDQEIAEAVLQQFVDKHLQSDQKYALSLVQSLAAKGKGPVYIQHKAEQHGIEHIDIDELAQTLDIDWFDMAKEVKVKRFGTQKPSDWNVLQKQKRFLQSRGFTMTQIDHAFK